MYKSRFRTRFLGVWLIINGFAYLAMSFTGLLLPQHEDMVSDIAIPAQLGEMAFVLWLLVKGVNGPKFANLPYFLSESAQLSPVIKH